MNIDSPIALRDLGGLYRIAHFGNPQNEGPNHLVTFLTDLRSFQLSKEKPLYLSAMKSLGQFINYLKENDQARLSSTTVGIELLKEFKEANGETLKPLLVKVSNAVKELFKNPEHVKQCLTEEVSRQNDAIVSLHLSNGLFGLLELSKRQNLRYDLFNNGRDLRFLNTMCAHISTILHSFSQKPRETPEAQGHAFLDRLIVLTAEKKESLKDILKTPATERLINMLVRLKDRKEDRIPFYQDLRKAVQQRCKDRLANPEEVLDQQKIDAFVSERVGEISSAQDPEKTKENEFLAQQRTQALKHQENHNRGVLMHGFETVGSFGEGQVWGDTVEYATNRFNHLQAKSGLLNFLAEHGLFKVKDIEKAEEKQKEITRNYFQNKQLYLFYDTLSEDGLRSTAIEPIEAAIRTVGTVIDQKVKEDAASGKYLLPVSKPCNIVAKEVILFGILHIFDEKQCDAVLKNRLVAENHDLTTDPEILKAIAKAKETRWTPPYEHKED